MKLPITAILEPLMDALAAHGCVILEAPPGAGKTTMVPLEALKQSWLSGKKILLLQPRRIAVKAAALRLSKNLALNMGEKVGYRMRGEQKIGRHTQLEVITEGVLTRMLQADPSLEDVGLIIFDEFHERSLNNDLNLALCLEGRELFRQASPLKILIMSATLNSQESSAIFNNAPVIKSQGKSFPVDIRYSTKAPRNNDKEILTHCIQVTKQAIREQTGNILVFLPGKAEIEYVQRGLLSDNTKLAEQAEILPLYASLSFEQQQHVIRPKETPPRNHQQQSIAQIKQSLASHLVIRKKRKKT